MITKKILWIAFLLFVLLIASVFGKVIGKSMWKLTSAWYKDYQQTKTINQELVEEIEKTLQTKTINQGLVEAEKALSKRLPLKIDELTTLVRVSTSDKMFSYYYELQVSKIDLDLEFFQQTMKTQITNQACSQPEMRNDMAFGVTYQYVYEDNNSIPVADFTIDKEDCAG